MAAPGNTTDEEPMTPPPPPPPPQQQQQGHLCSVSGAADKKAGLDAESDELNAATHLLFFASRGDVEAVQEVLREGTSVNAADYDGRTALHLAASEGKMDVVRLLLAHGADVNPRDRWGSTPLTDARHYGFAEISDYLKERGAITPRVSPMAASPGESPGGSSPADFEVDPQEIDFRHATPIGKGPMGEITLANWRGTRVAVKTIDANVPHSSRLEKELFFLKKLRHPNIVQFLGAVTRSQPQMLVTEYLTGGDLGKILARKGPLPRAEAVGFTLDVARGMNYLHQHRPEPVVHRDLKPRNLLRSEAGHLKVADFGLSKVLEVQPADSSEDAEPVLGEDSYRYMAPEVFRKEAYDKSVDVYSFGIIVHEMFEGPVVEGAHTPQEVAEKYAVQNFRPPFRAKTYPPGMRELISECWSSEPRLRPSFGKILERLEAIDADGAAPPPRRSQRKAGGAQQASRGREPQGCACSIL